MFFVGEEKGFGGMKSPDFTIVIDSEPDSRHALFLDY